MANSAATAGSTTIINPQSLVLHIDILLLAIFLILTLTLCIPRTLLRLYTSSEWTDGFILRVQPGGQHLRRGRKHTLGTAGLAGVRIGYPQPVVLRHAGHDLRRIVSNDSLRIPLVEKPSPPAARRATPLPPPWCSIASGTFSSIFRTRIPLLPCPSLGHLILVLIYVSVFCYAAFLYSNPFTDPIRAGWIAASQVPLVVAFSVKNGVVGMLAGVGYERLNFFHRVLGRFLFLAINVHGLGYICKWQLAGTFSTYITNPSNQWGIVSLISVDLMVLFSLPPIRKRFHTFFLTTHIAGFTLALIAIYMHRPTTKYYVLTTCLIYGLDRIVLRPLKTRITKASIRCIPELGCTRVEIPSVNAGWRAGQHVRLQVWSPGGMGAVVGWMESHPFTIASVASSGEGVVLMCRDVGGWTGRLYAMAGRSGGCERGQGRHVRVALEGPYGGPGSTEFTSYTSALVVVGGSGVTFGVSVVQDMARREKAGTSRVRVCRFVWVVRDCAAIGPLLPLFTSLIQQSQSQSLDLSISIYITGTAACIPTDKSHPHIHIHTNTRPNIAHILERTIDSSITSITKAPQGMIVAVCGPRGMGDDVVRAVGNVSEWRRDGVGGVIDVHDETFGI